MPIAATSGASLASYRMGILDRLGALDRRVLRVGGGRSRYDRGYIVVSPQLDRDLDELRSRIEELEERLRSKE